MNIELIIGIINIVLIATTPLVFAGIGELVTEKTGVLNLGVEGMMLVGARAQNWLRQEKSYRAFGTELGRDATPLEADLTRFVDLDKTFYGKEKMIKKGVQSKCVTLLIDGPEDADPWGREALFCDNLKVGRLTSGGFSVVFNKQIGMGYVLNTHSSVGQQLEVLILGNRWPATIVEDSPYDPQNKNIRIDG